METDYSAEWIGVEVRIGWGGEHDKRGAARVICWEPYGAGMCDALVEYADGYQVWHSTHMLKPADGRERMSRAEAQRIRDEQMRETLYAIRAEHIRDFNRPWPGAEFGKTIIGNAINGAIKHTEARIEARRKARPWGKS